MLQTLAVVIGISCYESQLLSPLPGAAADARRVNRSLLSWGIPKEDIKVLIDKDATRRNILRALRIWPLTRTTKRIRLLVFFSGHGSRVEEPGVIPSSIILPHDVDLADRLGTGIVLSDFVGALSRIQPEEAYLFFDACSLRMDVVRNILPDDLPDADVLQTTKSRCLFCMVAAGLELAYEDAVKSSGFFTRSVLRQIARIRHTGNDNNCAALSAKVEEELVSQGLPAPWVYIIGSQQCWPLPTDSRQVLKSEDKESKRSRRMVFRPETVTLLRDKLNENVDVPFWLWGPSGIGKTQLVKQLMEDYPHSVYYSTPNVVDGASDFYRHLATKLIEQTPEVFSLGQPRHENPIESIAYLSRKVPGTLLTIDHLERLEAATVDEVVRELNKYPLDLLFVSRNPPNSQLNIFSWECPPLSLSEVAVFRDHYASPTENELPASFLSTVSGGSPLELRKVLSVGARTISEFVRSTQSSEVVVALCAIAQTEGYVDENLFRKVFSLSKESLTQLEEMGLTSFLEDRYVPHDTLIEYYRSHEDSVPAEAVIRYWSEQVVATPYHLWACQMLVTKFLALQVTTIESLAHSLSLAVESLARVRDWPMIEALGQTVINVEEPLILPAIFCAEVLIHVVRYPVVDEVLDELSTHHLELENLAKLRLIEAERCYWYGDFDLAIEAAQQVLDQDVQPKLIAQGNLCIGIARFFLGHWEQAIKHLLKANDETQADPRTLGWARMILGTIWGLRGVDVDKGRLLLQSSIRLLSQLGDEGGAAIAWNNLGEMTWKIGDYRTAIIQLTTAYKLAVNFGDVPTQLEATRNLIHARLRLNGPASIELKKLEERAKKLIEHVSDPMELMQVWNTFGTVSAYSGDIDQLDRFLRKSHPLTEDNLEYHIYTLANIAMRDGLKDDPASALRELQEAFILAKEGKNYLALKQMRDDLYFAVNEFQTPVFELMYEKLTTWSEEANLMRYYFEWQAI